jgi:hypothetical protein
MIAARQIEMLARESGIPDELVPSVSKLFRRVLDKQAMDERLNYQHINDAARWDFPFSQPAISLVESGRYYPSISCTLYGVVLSLGTAGTSTTTVEVKKNGTVVDSVSLGSGGHYALETFNTHFRKLTDYASVKTTAVGTGAKDLVALLLFKP